MATRSSAMPIVGALVGLTALTFISIPMLFAGALSPTNSSGSLLAGSVCATSGAIEGLGDDAAQNARTVAAVASARGGDRAALIALIAGLAESGLRSLGNPTDPTATGILTADGVGSDHDSLGIYQQRPSWGTAQERLDPVISTGLLLDRVLSIPDWDTQPPWQVTQTIQDSVYDGHPREENDFSTEYGGNYHAQLNDATRILNMIKKDSADLNCAGTGGSSLGTPPAGALDAHGLPLSYVVPMGGSTVPYPDV